MTYKTKGMLLNYSGFWLSILAPLAAVCSQFPMWVAKGEDQTMSGLFLVLAILCCVPFIKKIKTWLHSDTGWKMWVIITGALFALQSILEQLLMVAVVASGSSIVAEAMIFASKRIAVKPDVLINDTIPNTMEVRANA